MASRPTTDDSLMRDLVENRIETPEVEYKRWMPLTEPVERANIARHICALANYGGGYLVFGFEDDGSPSASVLADLSPFGHDAINGIVDRYLSPAPHCDVHQVTASSSLIYPVVRVSPHGEQPVCAKRDGPTDKGRPTGIVAGTHYVRVAGPKSVPIVTPELWAPVIRRCVFAGRSTLLTSIGQLFDGRSPAIVDQVDYLGDFRRSMLAVWDAMECPGWPVALASHRIAFTFRLLNQAGVAVAALPLDRLQEAIRAASFASSEDVKDGSASFEQRWQPGKRPFVSVHDDVDAYEALILPSDEDHYAHPTMWRVAASGIGGDVVAFPEDNPWVKEGVQDRSSRRWPAGGIFSPLFQARHVAQHVAFVARLAEAFPDVASAEVSVDYVGLRGRVIGDPRSGVHFSFDRRSAIDVRVARTAARVDILIPDIDDVTAELVGPVGRLFDGWDLNADAVQHLIAAG